MENFTNKEVTRVSRKTGTTNDKSWVKLGVQFGTDQWFNYFVNVKGRPEVKKGDTVAYAEYEDSDFGPQITLLRLPDDKPKTQDYPHPDPPEKPDLGPVSMYVSYHKDLLCAIIESGDYESPGVVAQHMDKIIQLADEFLRASITAGQKAVGVNHQPNTDPVSVPKLQPSGDYQDEPAGFMDGPDHTTEPRYIQAPGWGVLCDTTEPDIPY